MNYETALSERRYDDLRQLAERAGYTEQFEPADIRLLDFKLPASKERMKAALNGQENVNIVETLLWNIDYNNKFTLLKRNYDGVKFADCYETNEGVPALIAGNVHHIDHIYAGELSDHERTKMSIRKNRQHYPPNTIPEIIIGPTPFWILPKIPLYFLTAAAGYSVAANPENLTQKALLASALVSGCFVLNQLIHEHYGTGWYKLRGNAVNDNAVKKLLDELDGK